MASSPRIVVTLLLGVVMALVAALWLTSRNAQQERADEEPAADALGARLGDTDWPYKLVLPPDGHPLVTVRKGQRIPIHSEPNGEVVSTVGWHTKFTSHRAYAVADTKGRWAAVPSPHVGNDGYGWVKLDSRRLQAGWTSYSISIDLSERMAELHRRSKTVRSFSVSVGAPGYDTPTGHFAVTDSFFGGLNPAYGCCALALTAIQPHLASGWFGGHRIAIHGTMGPIGEAISHGCVRAADDDVRALVDHVPAGTPVVIRQ
jgi:hypothetical protein